MQTSNVNPDFDKNNNGKPGDAPPGTENTPVIKHPKFFFDDSLVVIQIENVQFRVHKYQLMKSETFSDMFEIGGKRKRDNEEGSSPENPIIMSEVAASDFEALLTVLYASRFSTSEPDPDASIIVPAFRLANMWNFTELRSSLLPLAEKALEDIDKILFGRQFNVDQWLEPAHTNLCQRPEPLTTDEAMKLGIHSVLLISHMREEFHPAKVASGLTSCGSCLGYNLNSNRWCSDCSCHSIQLIAKPISHNKLQEKVKKWVKNGCVLGCVNM